MIKKSMPQVFDALKIKSITDFKSLAKKSLSLNADGGLKVGAGFTALSLQIPSKIKKIFTINCDKYLYCEDKLIYRYDNNNITALSNVSFLDPKSIFRIDFFDEEFIAVLDGEKITFLGDSIDVLPVPKVNSAINFKGRLYLTNDNTVKYTLTPHDKSSILSGDLQSVTINERHGKIKRVLILDEQFILVTQNALLKLSVDYDGAPTLSKICTIPFDEYSFFIDKNVLYVLSKGVLYKYANAKFIKILKLDEIKTYRDEFFVMDDVVFVLTSKDGDDFVYAKNFNGDESTYIKDLNLDVFSNDLCASNSTGKIYKPFVNASDEGFIWESEKVLYGDGKKTLLGVSVDVSGSVNVTIKGDVGEITFIDVSDNKKMHTLLVSDGFFITVNGQGESVVKEIKLYYRD